MCVLWLCHAHNIFLFYVILLFLQMHPASRCCCSLPLPFHSLSQCVLSPAISVVSCRRSISRVLSLISAIGCRTCLAIPISLCNATIYRILPLYCLILCWLSWSPRTLPFSFTSCRPSSRRTSGVVKSVTRQWDSVNSCEILLCFLIQTRPCNLLLRIPAETEGLLTGSKETRI